jgi:uncharacterized cupredoxin-like copper-binding protein
MKSLFGGLLGLAACAVVMFSVAGCGGTQHAQSAETVVQVTEKDFHISAEPRRLAAGATVLRVENRGPDRHELIMVKAPHGQLPLRRDGMTLDEDALERATVGVIEPVASGGVTELRVHLKPGHYILFCNMSGHYMGGMHTELVVS